MKRFALLIFAIGLLLMATACGNANTSTQTTSCEHDYYLSDYTAPTATQNGSSRYTCKKCDNTYTEVIPATGVASDHNSDNGSYSRSSTKFNLADLPTYSINGVGSYAYRVTNEAMDVKGYKHKNIVHSCTYTSDDYDPGYVRFELEGKYSQIEGTIYLEEDGAGDYVWLEFYDGEDFLYSTEKIDTSNYKVSFSFDISGVNYLTIYPKRVGGGSWETPKYIIWDKITVSK